MVSMLQNFFSLSQMSWKNKLECLSLPLFQGILLFARLIRVIQILQNFFPSPSMLGHDKLERLSLSLFESKSMICELAEVCTFCKSYKTFFFVKDEGGY